MEDHQITGLAGTSGELEHPPGDICPGAEQPVVGVDDTYGIGHSMSDRFLADAVPSR